MIPLRSSIRGVRSLLVSSPSSFWSCVSDFLDCLPRLSGQRFSLCLAIESSSTAGNHFSSRVHRSGGQRGLGLNPWCTSRFSLACQKIVTQNGQLIRIFSPPVCGLCPTTCRTRVSPSVLFDVAYAALTVETMLSLSDSLPRTIPYSPSFFPLPTRSRIFLRAAH